jgi:hypothetical protein
VEEWITGCDEEIDIVDAVGGYARKAEVFDEWLAGRISRKHAVEIGDYQRATRGVHARACTSVRPVAHARRPASYMARRGE